MTNSTATVHRLPLPRWEPPYDDERPSRRATTARPDGPIQGTLALSFLLPTGLPATPDVPQLQLVRTRPSEATEAATSTPVASCKALPEARGWAGRFAQAVVEVLAGDRPVSQLSCWIDDQVLADVQRRVDHDRPRRLRSPGGATRAKVRSVHVMEPANGVAEVCALVLRGARATAIAMRLEDVDGRWRCTALELE